MHLRVRAVGLVVSFFALATVLCGCASSGPVWVDAGGQYTLASVSAVYGKGDITRLAQQPSSAATSLRHEALTALRRRGATASTAADVITRSLPPTTRGVPVYVEKASVNGTPAYVIIDATGPSNGNLSTKRLWVLSDKGSIMFVGTR